MNERQFNLQPEIDAIYPIHSGRPKPPTLKETQVLVKGLLKTLAEVTDTSLDKLDPCSYLANKIEVVRDLLQNLADPNLKVNVAVTKPWLDLTNKLDIDSLVHMGFYSPFLAEDGNAQGEILVYGGSLRVDLNSKAYRDNSSSNLENLLNSDFERRLSRPITADLYIRQGYGRQVKKTGATIMFNWGNSFVLSELTTQFATESKEIIKPNIRISREQHVFQIMSANFSRITGKLNDGAKAYKSPNNPKA